MKDFDTERHERHAERAALLGDRAFKFGGETFTFYAAVPYEVLRAIAALGDETVDSSGAAVIDGIEATVLALIEDIDGAHDRFREVCRRQTDPVTFFDLNALCTWLIEQQVGRPTAAPSPSTDGRESTSTESTEISSSPPAAVSAV